MVPKRKYPRADALAAARELVAALRPVTAEGGLVVAGSLRRRKPQVGDVELLYIPRFETVRDGLFDTAELNQADALLQQLLAARVLAPRPNVHGITAWGPRNKFAVHVASGIPVDLFSATPANWWNYLVCRTGSADSNTRIAGAGFTDQRGVLHRSDSEQDVFAHADLPYLEPWQR